MTQRQTENATPPQPSTGDSANPNFPKIHDFNAREPDNGYQPSGRLIMDAGGNVFGVATHGGLPDGGYGHGVVFRLSPAGSTGIYRYRILHKFQGGSDGGRPKGGLMMDSEGNLYGTTSDQGTGYVGTVFKLKSNGKGGWGLLETLHQFSALSSGENWDGAAPTSHLVMDSSGVLYGTTSAGGANGGGTVFSLTRQDDGSYKLVTLHSFGAPPPDAITATGGLFMDSHENLYGVSSYGGQDSCGEVFVLSRYIDGSYTFVSLYSFPPGYPPPCEPQIPLPPVPFGSLVMDASGHFFGTTFQGGTYQCGSVYQYEPGSDPNQPTTLYAFNDLDPGGSGPLAGVIRDSAGNLFGTTEYSSPGNGAVYKLTNNGDGTYTYATIFEFTEQSRQGAFPGNNLLVDSSGHLFGTTREGGAYDGGVVFKIGGTAQAIATMEGGVVLSIAVTDPGSAYASPPTVTISPSANGMTAQAVAKLSNGRVTEITLTNQGSGYDFGPQVVISSPWP